MAETSKNNEMTGAIISAILGLLSTVGSVVTSTQSVKAQKLELQGLEAKTEAEADLAAKNAIAEAYKAKQAEYEAEVQKQKSTTTFRGLILVLVVAIGAVFGFKILKEKNG